MDGRLVNVGFVVDNFPQNAYDKKRTDAVKTIVNRCFLVQPLQKCNFKYKNKVKYWGSSIIRKVVMYVMTGIIWLNTREVRSVNIVIKYKQILIDGQKTVRWFCFRLIFNYVTTTSNQKTGLNTWLRHGNFIKNV